MLSQPILSYHTTLSSPPLCLSSSIIDTTHFIDHLLTSVSHCFPFALVKLLPADLSTPTPSFLPYHLYLPTLTPTIPLPSLWIHVEFIPCRRAPIDPCIFCTQHHSLHLSHSAGPRCRLYTKSFSKGHSTRPRNIFHTCRSAPLHHASPSELSIALLHPLTGIYIWRFLQSPWKILQSPPPCCRVGTQGWCDGTGEGISKTQLDPSGRGECGRCISGRCRRQSGTLNYQGRCRC